MLPEGWKNVQLGEISKVTGGKRLPKGGMLVSHDTGYPYIRVTDMLDGGACISNIKYVPENLSKAIEKYRIFKDDLFITVAGTIGVIGSIPDELNGANLTENADRISEIKANKIFLMEFLRSPFIQSYIENVKTNNAQPKLALEQIRTFPILLPPLPEQKKIAAILSTWDRAIEGTEKLLANSQQQKKALMQQLLTGKKRLRGFTGEWKKVSLEKTGKIVSGGTPDTTVPAYWDGDVLWLTPTDVTSLREKYVDDTKRKITQAGIKDSATTLLPAGSLLVCTRATIGYMAIAKKPITTNQGFKNIVFNKLFLPEFVYYFLCTQKHEMQRLASGSTFAEISKKDFCKIHISAPPLPEQKAIAAVLTTADEEITALESDLSHLRQEKKALMQQLLTGKRRVTVD